MERKVSVIREKIYSSLFLILFTVSLTYSQQETGTFRYTGDTSSLYNAEQIFELTRPSLVSIWYHTSNFYDYWSYSYKDTTILNGSGFIISEDGFIGTNYHVVDGIDSILVKTYDGFFYDAELIIMDEKNDLAIIRIKNPKGVKFKPVKIGNSDIVKVGQDVFAIGSPFGYEYTISQGIVAGVRENEKVSFTDPKTYMLVEKNFDKVIQITAAISPGNSGGALFNRGGEVIGITTYTYGGYGNLNFAIAINSFMYFKSGINLAEIDTDEETIRIRAENLYNSYLKFANGYKSDATSIWFYVKQKDTMTVPDSFIVKQDSVARLNFSKSENYYFRCLDIAPDSFIVYQELMDLYVYTENFTKAENLYETIKERFESDSLLNLLSSSLASAYSGSKEYSKALAFYSKMSSKDTNDLYIRFQIADLYEKMEKYKKAIKEYKYIISKDPSYTQAYMQLGVIYYEKYGDYNTAEKYLKHAYDMEIANYGTTYFTNLPYYLGMIAARTGRKTEAILYYLDLKSIYTYTKDENMKKANLLNAIRKMR